VQDYCNCEAACLAWFENYTINTAARFVTGTHKFDHGLSRLLHDDLYWLEVPERIQYKTGITVPRFLHSKVPKYLTNCCAPVSEIASRCHLRSGSQHHLSVPRYQLTTFGCRAFSVAGLMVWNSLTDSLRDLALSSSNFRKTTQDGLLHPLLSTLSAIEMLHDSALYKCTIDIDTDRHFFNTDLRKFHL